ncbi:binding-protein-dependent transport system inner membrane protein [Lelliottia amnigena]|nr:binding-protein-dependent transport system inner membrane protein [Lelliottia amnigena]
MDTIHYMLDNWSFLLTLTFQHLWLVGLAVGLAIIIGVPLGILIVRHKWLATPVLGIATIVLTIPSIALFGLMIPLFFADRSGDWCPARHHRRVPLFTVTHCA